MAFDGFKADELLLGFDVYPKVFVKNKETEIHICPTGGNDNRLTPNTEYTLVVCALEGGNPKLYPASGDFREKKVATDENCAVCFTHSFDKEQEYFLRFIDCDGKRVVQFPVYCVDEDLAGRYPLMGDLHMHTRRSDGHQDPALVAANYHAHGYDFFAITDHHRYYPALEAIAAYKDVPTEFNIVPGEEVHLPDMVNGHRLEAHIVNFGGEYSINALVEDPEDWEDEIMARETKSMRSIIEDCPDVMTLEEFSEKMEALAQEITVPEGVDKINAAIAKWIYDEIRKAGGLGIFPHPTWISNVFHVPEAFNSFLFDNRIFDAFEVLGGENYYEHNGFQTHRYYDECAKGNRVPVVGSTDSHSSYHTNRNGFICKTLVFSPENERKALIKSIKDYYSVAIDTINEDFRIVGETRLARYTCFLLKNFFPLHDALCFEEGRLMKQYVYGTPAEKEEAKMLLTAINGRIQRQREKYFAF